jgi:hypothetical protein
METKNGNWEVVSVNQYANTDTVTLPRWGTVPDIPIFYHCDKETNINNGYRAFAPKHIVIVLVKGGRTLRSVPAGYEEFLASSMVIVSHGKFTDRPTIKQPVSCKWETFTLPWWFAIGGVYTEAHAASEHIADTMCIKHKWSFNGLICPKQSYWDALQTGWGHTQEFLNTTVSNGQVASTLEWTAAGSWDGDNPWECTIMRMPCSGSISYSAGDRTGGPETFAWVKIVDDLGNKARIYFYKDDYVLNAGTGSPPYAQDVNFNEYMAPADKDINEPLTNYKIYGKISEVRVEVAAKNVGGNQVTLNIHWIDFY